MYIQQELNLSNSAFLVGSTMLRLSHPRDEDYISQHKIVFLQQIMEEYTQGRNHQKDSYKALFIYQLSCGFHCDIDYPFKSFNIFDHRDIWISHLQAYMRTLRIQHISAQKILPKEYYHLLYQYYMIVENAHYISAESLAEVQKIHDLEVPGFEIYRIQELINSLIITG